MNGPKHKLCTKLSSTYLRKWWITIGIGAVLIIAGVLVACQFSVLINAIIDRMIALRPGSKTFGWWAKPPVEPRISLYVYNVTNADDFLSNGSRAIVDEVGPYVYSETWEKVNIVEHDNGTLSYNLRKIYKFREDLSAGPEDDVVIVPNIPMLSATSQSKHAARFLRLAMASIMDILKIKPFVQVSVGQLLWGYEDPLLKLAKDVVPKEQKLPYEEFGLLYGKNGTSSDRVTVFTGTDNINHYGIIDKFNGRTHLPHWTTDECNRLSGTDGSIFPPHITKDRVLEVYDKDLCRLLPLVFEQEVMTSNEVPGYRFTPPEWVFADVDSHPDNMCYCPAGKPSCSPNGLFNVSLCQYDSPIMLSFPHFYLADDSLRTQVDGISPPEKEQHQFYFDVQPKMGTTLSVRARIQINLAVSQVFDIKQVANFPDIIFPILWFEEGIDSLPDEVTDLMRFAETIPPKIRVILILVLCVLGVILLLLSTFCLIRNSHRQSTLHLEGSNYLATAQVDMNKKQNKDNNPNNARY
ncbi:scavenger receptor class B member 1 isoform X1 [Drosophila novamexicana]|uniref:scavenger receptor class B member 1 isoform X1 n=1 Tax=Drosophila novamexicana TaxID=47314 RepID=UPI0011E5EB6A|nr:scavenger receptor class B member 1 isoform X1 [Drosophila novamexicana]XP_030558452.1 scavenger receptor class B member 1 isoform X1 [Drosophila novamexicana]